MKNSIVMRIAGIAVIALFMTVFLPDIADATVTKNISDGSITVKDSEDYTISGTSAKNHITVEKGNPTITIKNLEIDLCDEADDGKSVEAAPISIKKGCSVTLIVDGNCSLYGGNNTGIGANWGYAGINIEKGASLTIKGDSDDKLIVYGGGNYGGSEEGAAAIGSNADCDMGSLTINDNLTIEAYGAVKAAGIGGGCDEVAGDITISGGNITAEGGRSAAGIGCGDSVGSGDGGNGNNITISGGNIKATGGSGAAGIGGSDGGDLNGTIRISGGNVTAAGGEEGAGIGGGLEGYVSKITIEGGTVNATGGKNAAGIGGGNAKGSGDGGDVGDIYIAGGKITAYGGGGKDESNGEGGAGIGGGDGGEVGSLEIKENSHLEITAYGGKWGAGIGSATGEVESHNIDTIKITLDGGSIKAVGGYQGAGIGGGNTSVKNINIYGKGNIEAVGKNEGAGIGAGEGEDGGNITIKGNEGGRELVIKAISEETFSTAVIGGADSCGEDITLTNAKITLENKTKVLDPQFHSSGIGNGHNTGAMGDILIENCDIEDKQGTERHGSSIGAGWCADVGSITIKKTDFVGGTIGASYSGELINEVKVDGITIEDSDIHASNTSKQIKAAIGSGQNTVVTEINIRDSKIYAYSASGAGIGSGGYESDSKGDAVRWTGGSCGDVNIEGSEITAFGNDGGAGIGGGWGTSVDDVTIVNSKVKAKAGDPRHGKQGGAGIGGGYAESSGVIMIKKSEVEAVGTGYSAGIGCGGIDTMATFWWDTTCLSIVISSSDVTATGGTRSAGIGTGCGAQFGVFSSLEIDDSTVKATGGEKAAGIGAGSNGSGGSGGEACDINIIGRSKVDAKGGDGGAGIGGGYGGGADTILIDLDETTYDSKTDSWKYYVNAVGGKGGAGLGGGGEHGEVYDDIPFGTAGHGADSIRINGGYVYAHGGDEDKGDYAGCGAGIGGGGRGGRLEELVVTGGFIVAHSGTPLSSDHAGNDMGYGGGYDPKPILKDGDAKISGGTLIGDLSDEFDIKIDGGSVSCHTTKAERTDGTQVYQTKLQTGENYFKPKDFKVSLGDYGTTDIFSADNGRIYLYLPTTDSSSGSTADYTYNGESRHYYGKTTDDSNAWIKMDGKLTLEGPETEPAVGDDFAVSVKSDAGLSDGTKIKFTLAGNPYIKIVEEETVPTMPGAKVVLNAEKRTEYAITANAENETEMYWSAKGTYKGRVTKDKGTIDIVEDPTKVYDGKAVENPAVSSNSYGNITYKYFEASDGVKGSELSGAPVNAGEYIVQASIEETSGFTGATAEKSFKIHKRSIVMDLTAREDGGDATVYVAVAGVIAGDSPGRVSVFINGDERENVKLNAAGDDGICTEDFGFKGVQGDTEYTVSAKLTESSNYICTNSPTKKFYKNRAERSSVRVNNISASYGGEDWSAGGDISVDYGETGKLTGDKVSYSLIYDESEDNRLVETAEVDETGHVTYKNAGVAVVKVKVSNDAYEEAVAYSVIKISRADLKVTSYAYRGENTAGNRVDEIAYGSADSNVKYGLEYEGFKLSDDAGNFANGTLEAAPLNETVPAGDATIEIVKKGNPFISRNYKLDLKPGKVKITPAILRITADDKTGTYGTEPDYTYSFGDEDGKQGLMPWDKPEDVIMSVGTKNSYESYKPGEHEDAIVVETKSSNSNYAFSSNDGTSTVKPGKLTVKKADVSVTVEIKSKVYDGEAIEPSELSAVPVAELPAEKLEPCQKVKIRYFELTEEDSSSDPNIPAFALYRMAETPGMKELSSAPKDSGNYIASAYVDEDDYYNSAAKAVTFTIRKARCDVETPKVPDMEMKDGLKLGDQKLPSGWAWIDPDEELNVGRVGGYAVYTPEDTRNYYKELRTVRFNVYEKESNNDNPDSPGGNSGDKPGGSGNSDNNSNSGNAGETSGNGNGTRTGDDFNVMIWLIAAILALTGAATTVYASRRNK